MSESDSTTLTKVCTKCGREHPATMEYFHASAASKLQAWCKECMVAYGRAYRSAHHAERAAYDVAYNAEHSEERAAYRADHSEERRANNAAYLAAHREEGAAIDAAYRATHREEIAAYKAEHREEQAAYRAAHRAERAASNAAYRPEHRNELAAYERNRKARKKGNGGTHTADDVKAQYARQRGKCYWQISEPCKARSGKLGGTYHVDHVMPVILGGSNGPENLVISCPTCNISKGGKHPMEFAGRLL